MARVKIRTGNPKDPRLKQKLLEILSTHDVYVTKIIETRDAFVILTNTDQDLDKIFNGTTEGKLEENNFFPQLPPALQSQRSVMIFNVDQYIYDHHEADMEQEITEKNRFTQGEINTLFKFPKSRTIKITFNKTQIAKKTTEVGLRLFAMSIPPHQIKQHKFYDIKICYKCYEMETHTTRDCPKGTDYKICSECGSEDHIWRDCHREQKKCINCGDEHRTMAMRCPKRKEIINNKRKEEENRQNNTYSNIVKSATINIPQGTQQPPIRPETHSTIFSCMMHAHLVNMAKPGTYEIELNKMLKLNNLPPIRTPANPPSKLILDAYYGTGQANTEETETTNMDTTQEYIVETQAEAAAFPITETMKVTDQRRTDQEKEKTEPIKGKDIGLVIYTPKSQGWPKEGQSINKLTRRMEEKQIQMDLH